MRKRFMKTVVVGTFVVVVSAIVAGPAFGGTFVPSSTNQGFPPSQQVQSTFVPGYSDFPNVFRLQSSLTAKERKQLDAAVARTGEEQRNAALQRVHQPGVTSGYAALPPEVMRTPEKAKTSFVPGYSDFPNALRRSSGLTPTEQKQLDAAVAQSNSKGSFVPGFSDFPNALRNESGLTSTERKQLDAAVASVSDVSSGSGTDWGDAGVGAGIGLVIAGGLVVLAVAGLRRNRATPVAA
jgi:hypothetical protein